MPVWLLAETEGSLRKVTGGLARLCCANARKTPPDLAAAAAAFLCSLISRRSARVEQGKTRETESERLCGSYAKAERLRPSSSPAGRDAQCPPGSPQPCNPPLLHPAPPPPAHPAFVPQGMIARSPPPQLALRSCSTSAEQPLALVLEESAALPLCYWLRKS